MGYNNEFAEYIGPLRIGVYKYENYDKWIRRGNEAIYAAKQLGIKIGQYSEDFDKRKMPENQLSWNNETMKLFNDLTAYLIENGDNLYEPAYFTNKGCLGKIGADTTPNLIALSVTTTRLNLFLRGDCGMCKLSIGGKHEKSKEVSFWGKQGLDKIDSFQKKLTGKTTFQLLRASGHELTAAQGWEVKKSIIQPKKIIYVNDAYKDEKQQELFRNVKTSPVFENCYHDDMNSSFCAGIVSEYPEIAPGILAAYEKRQILKDKKEAGKLHRDEWYENELLKFCLSSLHGKFQEKQNPVFAQVAKAGIDYNNAAVDERIDQLEKAGYLVIAINVDGIWYKDPTGHKGPYTNENNGTAIGQWKTDHKKVTLRFKSPGSYEFIENGIYNPVMSGCSSYEDVVPRSKWKWGDIFKGEINQYYFDRETAQIKDLNKDGKNEKTKA